MQDPSKILQKAKELAAGRDISAKREALAYHVLYSAVTKDTRVLEQFLELLLAEEKKTGKRGIKYVLFGQMFRPKDLAEHAQNIRSICKSIGSKEGIRVLSSILEDPLRSIDPVPDLPKIAEHLKKEYKCSRETAFAIALFTITWPDETRRARDYLLERKKDL